MQKTFINNNNSKTYLGVARQDGMPLKENDINTLKIGLQNLSLRGINTTGESGFGESGISYLFGIEGTPKEFRQSVDQKILHTAFHGTIKNIAFGRDGIPQNVSESGHLKVLVSQQNQPQQPGYTGWNR